MPNLMLDFETLGTTTDTVVLTIGVVTFDPKGTGVINRLELRPSIDDQTSKIYNRSISEDTLAWWSKQSPEAINEAMGDENRIPYKECFEQLHKFCWNQGPVWSNGSVFDVMIAEHAFNQLGMKPPWTFWNIRDCRTIYSLTNLSLKDNGAITTHKAIEDAEKQAILVQKGYQKLIAAGFVHLR